RPSPGCSPSASTRDSRCRRCKSRRRRQPEADRDSRRRRPSRTPASPSASSRSQSASSATFYTRASGDSSATATPEWSSGSRGLTKGKAVFPPWRLVENVEEFDRRRRRRHKRRERLKSERSSPASSNNSSNQRDQLPSASPRQEQPQQTPKHRGQTRHLSTINNMNSVIEPQDSKNHLQPPQLQQARPAVYQRYTDANRSARLSITGSRDHLPLAEHQMPQPQRDRCNYQPVSTGHAKRQPAVTLDYRYPIEQGISFDTAHDLSQRQKHGLASGITGPADEPQFPGPPTPYPCGPPSQPQFDDRQGAWPSRHVDEGFPNFDDGDSPDLRQRNGDDFALPPANFSSSVAYPAGGLHVPWRDSGWPGLQAGAQQFGQTPQFPDQPTPFPCGPPSQQQFNDFNVGGFNSFGLV
uniref:PDZ domain-containing protein n=1 Tax=Macrostomum lignano TaxID=282301 RepID=A0A1I8G7G4_9PLAT